MTRTADTMAKKPVPPLSAGRPRQHKLDRQLLAALDAGERRQLIATVADQALKMLRRMKTSDRDKTAAMQTLLRCQRELRDEDTHVGAVRLGEMRQLLEEIETKQAELHGDKPTPITVPAATGPADPVH